MDDFIEVPGARLRVRSGGSGPVLLLLGGAADGGGLGVLRDLLEPTYTVVTYDRRGLGGSTVADPEAPVEVADDADDAAAILAALTPEPALVAGTSNGAVQGLELALRHPNRVRILLAHEPPLPQLLPPAERDRITAAQAQISAQLRQGNPATATALLATLTGLPTHRNDADATRPKRQQPAESGTPPTPPDDARAAFLRRVALPLHRYRPDPAALTASPVTIVIGAGEEDPELVGPLTAKALARLRHTPVTVFPGGHAGYLQHPAAFTATLNAALLKLP